ncbi:MAG TPA: extracellular solute-binding protein [Bacilli bacterium]|nr:extracellular solute-binding protein [Bacilli bacterium]
MKRILLFLTILGSIFMLSACKNRPYDPIELVSIEEIKSMERINISFMIPFGQDIENVIRDMIADFNEEYPNIRVKIEVVGGYDTLLKEMRIKVAGKNPPTLAIAYPDHVAEYLRADAVLPLTPYIESDLEGVGYTEEELADFFEEYMFENRSFDDKGTYYSLPFNKSTEVLIYNKDFFDAFKDEISVPRTWQEAEEVSKKIWEIILSGRADNLYDGLKLTEHLKDKNFVPFAYDSNGNLFITATRQWGGKYTERIDNSTGKLLFMENDKSVEAFKYLHDLARYTDPVTGKEMPLFQIPEYWAERYSSNPFKNLQTMFTIGSTAGIRHHVGADSKVRALGVAPVVYRDEDHKYVIQQGSNIMISKRGNKYERMAAWLLIKHFLKPENTAKFSIETAYFPVRKSALQLPEYQEFLNTPTIEQEIHSQTAKVGIAYRELGFEMFVDPAWAGSAEVRKQVDLAVVSIFSGSKVRSKDDVRQIIKTAYDKALKEISR